MPGIVAKVEGQGNGIKTVIVNMVDIARALNREPVCKYFIIQPTIQSYLSSNKVLRNGIGRSNSNWREKRSIHRQRISRRSEAARHSRFLSNIIFISIIYFKLIFHIVFNKLFLDVYIKKFVLCSKCENPETTLTVKRDDIIEVNNF